MKITWQDCLGVMNFYYNSYEALKEEYGENSLITKKYKELFETKIIYLNLTDVYNDLVELTNDDSSKVKDVCKNFLTNWIEQTLKINL
mgnify:CR=1 FL=1